MSSYIGVSKVLGTASFMVFAADNKLAELVLNKGMGLHNLERCCAAVGTSDFVFSIDHLSEVIVNAGFAETFAAL